MIFPFKTNFRDSQEFQEVPKNFKDESAVDKSLADREICQSNATVHDL